MPRTQKLIKFPAEMQTIAYRLQQEPVPLKCASNSAAQRLRFRFYDLRKAITAEGREHDFPTFMRAVLTIDGDTLWITPPEKANAEMAEVLSGALAFLGGTDGPVPPTYPVPMSVPLQPLEPVVTHVTLADALAPSDDPYEKYLRKEPEHPLSPPLAPDPFDLSETRNRIDTFERAVADWLSSDPDTGPASSSK